MNPIEFTPAGNYDGYSPVHTLPELQGWAASRRNAGHAHNLRVVEAAKLYARCLSGQEDPVFLREAMLPRNEVLVAHLMQNYPRLYGDPGGRALGLRETMSVTDYQALYVDVLDRMYYGRFGGYPIVNKPLVKSHTLRDFRTVKRYLLDGMVTPLTAAVADGSGDAASPWQQRNMYGPTPQNGASLGPSTSTAAITYDPKLYHAGTAVNWRAFVNDDLGIFNDLSNNLALAGNRGISKYITQQFFDTNGPHASLYTSGYKNIISIANGASSTNPRFSAQGVQDALKVLARQVDAGGDPIVLSGRMYLVHGPNDVAVAANLKNALSVQVSVEGGTTNANGFPSQFVNVNNWLLQNMELIMDPYIPIVCTTSGRDSSWAIVVDPNSQPRPAVEMGFLSGFETPQIFSKVPNTQRMGGGVDPMMGDFYTMDQELKIMTIFGSVVVDGRTTVGSNGSGS